MLGLQCSNPSSSVRGALPAIGADSIDTLSRANPLLQNADHRRILGTLGMLEREGLVQRQRVTVAATENLIGRQTLGRRRERTGHGGQ